MREAIILAGGKGTRIQHLLPGIPKCMAPIRGIPFVSYLIEYLISENTVHFIFSLGHMHDQIIDYLDAAHSGIHKSLIIEQSPLGTGGAICKSMESVNGDAAFVLNGDTWFPVSLDNMEDLYRRNHSDLVLASTLLEAPDRFGTISFDNEFRITSFHEKRILESGYINGGTYLISKAKMMAESKKEAFSLETGILETMVREWNMYASVQDIPFIDIGIPEDYHLAQSFIPELNSGI